MDVDADDGGEEWEDVDNDEYDWLDNFDDDQYDIEDIMEDHWDDPNVNVRLFCSTIL